MIISFTLNGKQVSVDTPPEKRAIDLLREDFHLTRCKGNCYNGQCGSCSIILNGKVVPACMLPVFAIKNMDIVTIEGFSKTKEYFEITKALKDADIEPCDYCKWGKILAIHELIESGKEMSDKTVLEALAGNQCNCTDYHALIETVKLTAKDRRRRKNVPKI